ncbi:hypothetical protein QBC44DRAFT_379722 [Cladorrhinum sp. PSN332]|nr:hypothetical protein QBC44DRAFT_379722 [Cladorrhinum sp. PSN332]
MARPPPLLSLLLALLSIISLASASAPTFCKCTCFTNSTIIPLGPQGSNPNPNQPDNKPPSTSLLTARSQSSSCTQCNRAFCLKYNLPICKDAEEKDIVTSCFQRDSRKDQIIVWGFILGTAGLLGWAGVKKVVEGYENKQTRRGTAQQQQQDGGGVLGRVLRMVGGSGPGGGGGGGNTGGQTQGVIRRGGGGGGGGQDGGSYTPL